MFLSAAFRFWLSHQKLKSICFWLLTSVGENEEKANTIQTPPSCVFLTFRMLWYWSFCRLWSFGEIVPLFLGISGIAWTDLHVPFFCVMLVFSLWGKASVNFLKLMLCDGNYKPFYLTKLKYLLEYNFNHSKTILEPYGILSTRSTV